MFITTVFLMTKCSRLQAYLTLFVITCTVSVNPRLAFSLVCIRFWFNAYSINNSMRTLSVMQ